MPARKLLCLLLLAGPITFAQEAATVSLFEKSLNTFLNVRDCNIAADGSEAFFTVQSPDGKVSQLLWMKKNGERWRKPELLPFCDAHMYMEPFLSQDGKRLFFASDRPAGVGQKTEKNFDIWYVERDKVGSGQWSTPINLGKPVNSGNNEFYPSLSDNGYLYFTMEAPGGIGKDDIYYCRWNGQGYEAPVLLNENVNSEGYEFNAFISRQETFLLYTRYDTKDGYGSGDLYISRKDPHGNWLPAENLGRPINTPYMEYCPFYDEQHEVLYFTSKRNKIAPKKFRDLAELQQSFNEGENGLSKLYQVKIKLP